jgi:hypothetical protein
VGRFTSVDPFGPSARVQLPTSFNRYSYAAQDPITFTDASGLDCDDDKRSGIISEIERIVFGGPADRPSKGILQRISEQIYGEYSPRDVSEWFNHNEQIRILAERLARQLDDWDSNNCGPGNSPPPLSRDITISLRDLSTKRKVEDYEYKGPNLLTDVSTQIHYALQAADVIHGLFWMTLYRDIAQMQQPSSGTPVVTSTFIVSSLPWYVLLLAPIL